MMEVLQYFQQLHQQVVVEVVIILITHLEEQEVQVVEQVMLVQVEQEIHLQ
jgi:hypothetical protein